MSVQGCTVPGCERRHNARGYCHMHYWRLRKYGDALVDVPAGIPRHKRCEPCFVDGCDRPSRRNGLCEMHDKRMKATGTTDDPIREKPPCSVPGCDRPHVANGYCNAHRQRVEAHGDPRADVPLRVSHGHAAGRLSPTYESYRAMVDRCLRPTSTCWDYYGGRGVTICDRWLGSGGFPSFLADMGERPEGLTLDRIDPFGNYEPENCRWATRAEQSRNQRRHKAATT